MYRVKNFIKDIEGAPKGVIEGVSKVVSKGVSIFTGLCEGKQGREVIKESKKGAQGSSEHPLKKQHAHNGSQPRKNGGKTGQSEEEQQLLEAFFKRHPKLLPAGTQGEGKKNLRQEAEDVFVRNNAKIQKKQECENFHHSLHRNMLQEFGILQVLSEMFQAAALSDALRWEIKCSYAREQMEELRKLEKPQQGSVASQENPREIPTRELIGWIEKQMLRLESPIQRTEYLPLYESIKGISLDSENQSSLEEWLRESTAVVEQGMQALDPALREALREKYPLL